MYASNYIGIFTDYRISFNIMAAKGLRALVFIGSARENRLADRVTKFMVTQMTKRGWEVDTVGML